MAHHGEMPDEDDGIGILFSLFHGDTLLSDDCSHWRNIHTSVPKLLVWAYCYRHSTEMHSPRMVALTGNMLVLTRYSRWYEHTVLTLPRR